MITLSGKAENLPYSLSRWTDVPAAKWPWFQQQLDQQWMLAIDQRTSVPARWSLKPEDTLGLMFWTKDPENLIAEPRLKDYNVKIHVTVTGWFEVEKGAPGLYEGSELLNRAAKNFGPENVTWRFSPVPHVPLSSLDVFYRFQTIAEAAADGGISKVFVSFLQNNDLMPESRSHEEKRALLERFADEAQKRNIKLLLCADDVSLLEGPKYPNLEPGVCAPPEDYGPGVSTDTCGCAFVVDPFTVNESCTFGCQYCYAADAMLAPKKRNTTRGLPVVR